VCFSFNWQRARNVSYQHSALKPRNTTTMFFAVALRAAMAVSLAMFQSRPVNTHWNTTMTSYGETAAANGTKLLRVELLWARRSINCTVGEPAIAGTAATTTTTTTKCQDGEPSTPTGDSTKSPPPTMTAITTFWRAVLDDDLNAAASIRDAIVPPSPLNATVFDTTAESSTAATTIAAATTTTDTNDTAPETPLDGHDLPDRDVD
jgi:hypothetical protein